MKITQHYIDFETRQAILVGDGEHPVTFTLIDDLALVVANAVDYNGIWPTIGGVAGWQTTSAELIRVGERVRGGRKFKIYRVEKADLDVGEFKSSWCPILEHPAITNEQLGTMSRQINLQAMKGIAEGAWTVSDEWNRRLPDFTFADPVKFLERWWAGKP